MEVDKVDGCPTNSKKVSDVLQVTDAGGLHKIVLGAKDKSVECLKGRSRNQAENIVIEEIPSAEKLIRDSRFVDIPRIPAAFKRYKDTPQLCKYHVGSKIKAMINRLKGWRMKLCAFQKVKYNLTTRFKFDFDSTDYSVNFLEFHKVRLQSSFNLAGRLSFNDICNKIICDFGDKHCGEVALQLMTGSYRKDYMCLLSTWKRFLDNSIWNTELCAEVESMDITPLRFRDTFKTILFNIKNIQLNHPSLKHVVLEKGCHDIIPKSYLELLIDDWFAKIVQGSIAREFELLDVGWDVFPTLVEEKVVDEKFLSFFSKENVKLRDFRYFTNTSPYFLPDTNNKENIKPSQNNCRKVIVSKYGDIIDDNSIEFIDLDDGKDQQAGSKKSGKRRRNDFNFQMKSNKKCKRVRDEGENNSELSENGKQVEAVKNILFCDETLSDYEQDSSTEYMILTKAKKYLKKFE